jgi:hypothetical protein
MIINLITEEDFIMDTTQLELELLDLEALYKNTRNKVTKSELECKIALKKKEIKEANTPKLEKNVIPSRDVASRMDHANGSDQRIKLNNNGSFTALI